MHPPRAAVYLDHHATTPMLPSVRAAMTAALGHPVGNPSSVHGSGRGARRMLEDARAAVALAVGASPREVVFTSGGTEAVHLGVTGVGEALRPTRVVCDPGAHPCVRAACEALARTVDARFTWLAVHPGGRIDLDVLGDVPGEGTLVALSMVQHETGAVADLAGVRENIVRRGAVLVLDAVQALGKLPLDVGATGAAAVAVSAHKIGGPAGIGALWLRSGQRAVPRPGGGGQERGLRAGSENLLGAVGFGEAARALGARRAAMPAVAALRDAIEAAAVALGGTVVNGAEDVRVATACNVSLEGVAGEELVAALDLEGYCVSSGAACSSGRAEPSESLLRLYPTEPWRARSALRVTLGPESTEREVADFIAALPEVVGRVRGLYSSSTMIWKSSPPALRSKT